MKTRYHTIDIRALVKNLQGIIGLRVANIYDINHRTYLIKLAKPDHKAFLLIESGTRIHTTEFTRDKSDVPSVFSLKLRKFLKTKRLESVVQLGVDRVVVFTFGSGLATQYLIVEMYAQGNIILTDGAYLIQALLRPYKISDDVIVAANHTYPIQTAKTFVPLTPERLREIITSSQPKDSLRQVFGKHLDFGPELVDHCILAAKMNPETTIENWKEEMVAPLLEGLQQGEKLFDTFSKENAAGYIVLRDASKKKPQKQQPQHNKQQQKQQKQAKQNDQKAQDAQAPQETPQKEPDKKDQVVPEQKEQTEQKGQQEQTPDQQAQAEEEAFEEVLPYPFLQYADRKMKTFPTFDAAVDKFFSQVEGQKEEVQKSTAETAVQKKIEKFKAEHTKRITSLQQAEASNERKAHLIEANLQEVEQCLTVVRSALGSGMDWGELASLVKEEKKKNPHSVANLIHRLVLDKNTVILLLSDPQEDFDDMESDEESSDEEEEDEEENDKKKKKDDKKAPNITRAPELVDVDIGISAFANARRYYELKKQSTQKAQKTVDKTEQALKAAERKSRKAMAEAKTKQGIMLSRKPFWFEKFFWFISSEDYLILYGRDAQQNEQLYKKYLSKDDLYVHADISGAATCIIKNKPGNPGAGVNACGIPPQTLAQAGTMCVCLSNAWQAKIVTSAWWVYANQVSKTAPTGEYLTTGSFMIRGKKNFLPPSQLVLGFAFMLRLDDESTQRHAGERSKARALAAEFATDATDTPQQELPIETSQPEPPPTGDHAQHAQHKDNKDNKKEQKQKQNEQKQKEQKQQQRKEKLHPALPKEEDDGPDVDITKFKISLVSPNPTMDDQDDDDDASTPGSTTSTGDSKTKKKRISAKDRRQQKKNKEAGTTNEKGEEKGDLDEKGEKQEGKAEGKEEGKDTSTTTTATTTTDKPVDGTQPAESAPPKEAGKPQQKDNKQAKDNNNKKGNKADGGKGKDNKDNKAQPAAKAGKKKKGKTKHDDELDEEELQARNLLLGIKKQQPKEEKKEKDDGKGKKKGPDPKQPNGNKKPPPAAGEKKVEKPAEKAAPTEKPTSASGETTPQVEGEAKREATEAEKEYSQLLKETEGDDDSDEEKGEKGGDVALNLNDVNLDCITGNPMEGDVLLHAVPVIAPYNVVAGFKFRVKVTPGHTKRGKAAKAAQEALFRQPNATQREKDLIRAVPLEELSRAMLANAKLHAPLAVRKAAKEKAGKDIDFEVSYEDDDKGK